MRHREETMRKDCETMRKDCISGLEAARLANEERASLLPPQSGEPQLEKPAATMEWRGKLPRGLRQPARRRQSKTGGRALRRWPSPGGGGGQNKIGDQPQWTHCLIIPCLIVSPVQSLAVR